ncbi:hypothetical protein AGMMS49928_03290 [Spirochaetia bacterium]|nr:hypothetical protein AGMMS49928_03290 [Spirochaetia bacterium]
MSGLLSSEQATLLPPTVKECGQNIFYDYLFIIEKYLGTHIVPCQYSVLYSSIVCNLIKDNQYAPQIKKIKKLFTSADVRINDISYNRLPVSANRYFDAAYNTKRRYVNDYIFHSHGIRHMYLVNREILLFFVIIKDKVIFLNIGKHEIIHDSINLEILVKEFSEYLSYLGINNLPGIDPGINLSVKEIKKGRKNNISYPPSVDNVLYLPALYSFVGININIDNMVFDEIINPVQKGIKDFITYLLENNHNICIERGKSKQSIRYGGIFLCDRYSKKEYCLGLPYFKKIQLIDLIEKELKHFKK